MSNIYNLTEEYLQLMNILEENEGLLDEELELRLDINKQNIQEKFSNYAKVIQFQKNKLAFADSEIERIKKYQKTVENSINRLEKTLLAALQLLGNKDKNKDIWRLETETFKFSTRKSNSVVIEDEDKIPLDCFIFKLKNNLDVDDVNRIHNIDPTLQFDKTPSKTLIKEKLEEGDDIDGAKIESKYSLTIK